MPLAAATDNSTIGPQSLDSRAVQQDSSNATERTQKHLEAKQGEIAQLDASVKAEQVSSEADEAKEQVDRSGQGWTAAALQKGAELKDTIASSSVVSTILEKGAELKDAVLEKLDELDEAAEKRGAEAREEARRKTKEMEDKVWAEVEAEQNDNSKGLAETATELKDAAVEKTSQLKDAVLETGGNIVEKISETLSTVKDAVGLAPKDEAATATELKPLLEDEKKKENENLNDETVGQTVSAFGSAAPRERGA